MDRKETDMYTKTCVIAKFLLEMVHLLVLIISAMTVVFV